MTTNTHMNVWSPHTTKVLCVGSSHLYEYMFKWGCTIYVVVTQFFTQTTYRYSYVGHCILHCVHTTKKMWWTPHNMWVHVNAVYMEFSYLFWIMYYCIWYPFILIAFVQESFVNYKCWLQIGHSPYKSFKLEIPKSVHDTSCWDPHAIRPDHKGYGCDCDNKFVHKHVTLDQFFLPDTSVDN